ncbi:MAG: hypothetical protein AAF598_06305 [Bacteroidota bacterium]
MPLNFRKFFGNIVKPKLAAHKNHKHPFEHLFEDLWFSGVVGVFRKFKRNPQVRSAFGFASVTVVLGLLVIRMMTSVQVNVESLIITDQNEKDPYAEQIALEMKLEAASLERNFNRLMAEGTMALEQGDFHQAKESYFYAKSIYPYNLESRLALANTFCQACKSSDRFCGNAVKEIKFGIKHAEEQISHVYKAEFVKLGKDLQNHLKMVEQIHH